MRPELYSSRPSNNTHAPDNMLLPCVPTHIECLRRKTETFRHLLLYTLAILGLFAIVREVNTLAASPRLGSQGRSVSCSCGKSVAEALKLGCKYDLLASAWLPEQCRDDELSAEFDRSGPGPNGEWTYVSLYSIFC